MKLISVEKMKQLESAANDGGYSYEKMMAKAGTNLATVVHEQYYSAATSRVLGLVGGGNNGGDTLIALAALQEAGWTACAVIVKEDAQWQSLMDKLREAGGKVAGLDQLEPELKKADLVLDGVIGTGFSGSMREDLAGVLNKVAKLAEDKVVVAVDCPSGTDCTSGEASPAVLKADLTVSMEAIKIGMLRFPAYDNCGDLKTVDLGIPAKFLKQFDDGDRVIDSDMVKDFLPERKRNSHKGTYGHLVVCGGCVNYAGAPVLSARSAYRAGAGLVESALPERIYESATANNPESIYTLLEDEDGVISENAAGTLLKRLAGVDCLLIGPGFGTEDTSFRFLQRVLFGSNGKTQAAGAGFVPDMNAKKEKDPQAMPPLVIDADGLRLLAKVENWSKKIKVPFVLTPHPGEMSVLTGLSVEEIQEDRINIARKFAQEWNGTLVLKGALTVVASPDGKVAVMPFASSALAKAGTGDVLAGLIAGLISQGVSTYQAATAGVWLHARAAELAVRENGSERSLLAGDLIQTIPQVFNELER